MNEVKWIKIASNIFDNRKIRQIECIPDGDSIIVVWVKLLCLAGDINDSGMIYFTKEIPYTYQMLATQFNRPLATIQLALKAQSSFIAAATGELTSALDESILNLRQIMKDTKAPHSVRVQAADIILRHCLRYTETNNILRRLERLEKEAERSDNI